MRFSAERMKRAREAAKLSQEAVARRCEVSVGSVRAWEAGEYPPGGNSVAALALALGCRLDDLYEADGSAA